jgi:hypothetical protein
MSKLAKLVYNKPFVFTLYFGLSLFAVVKSVIVNHIHNNYFVYKYNFINVIHQHTIFGYQKQFQDLNHYGPVFALLMAPFALLPDGLGVILWVMFNAWVLYLAIKLLPLKKDQYVIILLICAHELMTSSSNVEINPLIGGLIILSFVFIRDKKDFWAAFVIVLGTFIKLYGIVGLAFFFLSKDKLKFILSLLFWSAVLFVLPMFISSPSYIIQTYHDWYGDLLIKNLNNSGGASLQDISLMGLIRNIFNYRQLSNVTVLLPGLLLFALWYIRIKDYDVVRYQLLLLASTLIFVIIFSSSSESPTYIIAVAGVGIWFMNLERPVTWFEISLLTFAIVITVFSPSDLFPRYIKINYVTPYKLKALPCVLIWFKIIYEIVTRKFDKDKEYVPERAT